VRSFDWLIYAALLAILLGVLFLVAPDGTAPRAPPETSRIAVIDLPGELLPEPSPLDEQVIVIVGDQQDGVGTAFAVNTRGDWLTARHVVDGCTRVTLMVSPGNFVPVARLILDDEHDLALLSTGRSPFPVQLNLASPLYLGTEGYHVGFPQGRPGELATRLVARSRLVTRGRREGVAPLLAWAEAGRTEGLSGTLGGISGGPVFDAQGAVRGVIVAESPRRGRIYTAAPTSIDAFLTRHGVQTEPGPADAFSLRGYGVPSDNARRRLQVVRVNCEVSR
jgi:serine protease Do